MASKKSRPAKKAAAKKTPKKAVKKAPKKAVKRTAKKGGGVLEAARAIRASGFVVVCDVDGQIGGTFGTIGAANTFKTAHLAQPGNSGHNVVVQGSEGG